MQSYIYSAQRRNLYCCLSVCTFQHNLLNMMYASKNVDRAYFITVYITESNRSNFTFIIDHHKVANKNQP